MAPTNARPPRTAVVTGGSAGLGRALVLALAESGTTVVTDARSPAALSRVAGPRVITVPGDVSDPEHRADLVRATRRVGGVDLLVHNASTLGVLPMRTLAQLHPDDLRDTFEVNVVAPLALTAALLPDLRAHRGVLMGITSDAAVEHYPTWGPYAASKAALEQIVLTTGTEEGLSAYAVDPGDMRTQMHADAFAGEDISDRPEPETVVPALLRLIASRPDTGRYRAADLAEPLDAESTDRFEVGAR